MIDAYHAHDLDQCLSFYAPDVVMKRADGTIVTDGAEAVKARYAKSMADHPNLRYDIPNRTRSAPTSSMRNVSPAIPSGGPDVVRAVLFYRFDGALTHEILILS